MPQSSLAVALESFDATEANLKKLEALWDKIRKAIPDGFTFGAPAGYDDNCRAFRNILLAMPTIGSIKLEDRLLSVNEAVQMRLDAHEVGELNCSVAAEDAIDEQGRVLEEYRFALSTKRRELVRAQMIALLNEGDEKVQEIEQVVEANEKSGDDPWANRHISGPSWDRFSEIVSELGVLLGSSVKDKKWRWADLQRHLGFGMFSDASDIVEMDWPNVRGVILKEVYGDHDPLPVAVQDLGALVAAKPTGAVSSKLEWANINDEEFERLLFELISNTERYVNPKWLQKTRAVDKGRDLSVDRISDDGLGGVRTLRVIIQCKHWQTNSISVGDVSTLVGQMTLWPPPRVDELIIATSGRFAADAIYYIEKHNQSDSALHIQMWADSHLEKLLASRPHLVAQFRLRHPPQ